MTGTILRALAILAALLPAPSYAQRVQALGDLTFLVSPTGVDTGVCAPTPCRTHTYAANMIERSYDMRGFTPTISAADGDYPESVTRYGGAAAGLGPLGVSFLGHPADPCAVRIVPSAGPAFGINKGYVARINGYGAFPLVNGTGQDAIQVQNGGQLDLMSFCFGDNVNPYGDITVTGAGSNLTVLPWDTANSQSYSIKKTSLIVNAQAPGPGSSYTQMYVSSCTGIIPGMTVWGPHVALNTVTVWCASNVLAINNQLLIGFNPQNIYLCRCGQHHVAVSTNAEFSYGTNAGATPFEINISWAANYYAAWFVVSMNGTANLGATFNSVNNTAGVRTWVYLNGVLNSGSQGLGSLPGDTTLSPWSGGQVQ